MKTRKTGKGSTVEEMIAKGLQDGSITEAGMKKAEEEREADPEWQKFMASQSKKKPVQV